MNIDELIQFLKENLKIVIEYNGYAFGYDNSFKIKLILNGEEISSTIFSQDNNKDIYC